LINFDKQTLLRAIEQVRSHISLSTQEHLLECCWQEINGVPTNRNEIEYATIDEDNKGITKITVRHDRIHD
jgi:hypothetical protein